MNCQTNQTKKTIRNPLKYPTLYIEIFFLTLDQEFEAAEELLNACRAALKR